MLEIIGASGKISKYYKQEKQTLSKNSKRCFFFSFVQVFTMFTTHFSTPDSNVVSLDRSLPNLDSGPAGEAAHLR